jgi:hypothetical protein
MMAALIGCVEELEELLVVGHIPHVLIDSRQEMVTPFRLLTPFLRPTPMTLPSPAYGSRPEQLAKFSP